jgi:hypothetical protein
MEPVEQSQTQSDGSLDSRPAESNQNSADATSTEPESKTQSVSDVGAETNTQQDSSVVVPEDDITDELEDFAQPPAVPSSAVKSPVAMEVDDDKEDSDGDDDESEDDSGDDDESGDDDDEGEEDTKDS